VADTISKLNAADLVVSMAGYNTLSEILRFGKRVIVVPRPGPSAEQTMRARILAERGLIRIVEPDQLSARRLARVVQEELATDGPRQPNGTPRLQGVATVTDTLLGFLDPSRPEPARTAPVPVHLA
jgi:predicted glycosyltransferase